MSEHTPEEFFQIGVKGLIRNNQGEFLLLNLHPSRVRKIDNTWDLPGGRMDPGETFEDTLAREIKEELGVDYDTTPEFFTVTLTNIRFNTDRGEVALVLMFYLLNIPDNSKIVLSGEHTSFEWVDLQTAIDRLKDNYSDKFAQQMKTLE